MKYSFDTKIRYSETDAGGKLSWLGLVDYFQDCSVFHSEQLKCGLEYLDQSNKAWILISWRIILNEMPKLMDPVTVRTWAYAMRGFSGLRNFEMLSEDGRRLACADTNWVYMDMEKKKPVRIPDGLTELYQPEDAIPLEPCPRKIKVPETFLQEEPVKVPPYFIDTNHHMNNGRYVQVAASYLPEDYPVGELRVEYRASAMLGDLLYPRVSEEEDAITVNLTNESGTTYAVAQFRKKQA